MSLHSTARRGANRWRPSCKRNIVGAVILQGQRAVLDRPNMHYHQGICAPGDNTLQLPYCRADAHAGNEQLRRGTMIATAFCKLIQLMRRREPAHPGYLRRVLYHAAFRQPGPKVCRQISARVDHDTPPSAA